MQNTIGTAENRPPKRAGKYWWAVMRGASRRHNEDMRSKAADVATRAGTAEKKGEEG
jgi:hypothetical protein